MKADVLDQIFETIQLRKLSSPDESYTAQLFAKGENKILKKIGEETTELVMASVANDRENIIYEAGDVIYHMMVLLSHKDIEISEVYKELARRMGVSGLEEKASRKDK